HGHADDYIHFAIPNKRDNVKRRHRHTGRSGNQRDARHQRIIVDTSRDNVDETHGNRIQF
ncbi:unnamed protein product, partial [Nesidiocoris tenuis]